MSNAIGHGSKRALRGTYCDPLVFFPAFAMERIPGPVCLSAQSPWIKKASGCMARLWLHGKKMPQASTATNAGHIGGPYT